MSNRHEEVSIEAGRDVVEAVSRFATRMTRHCTRKRKGE